MEERLAALGVRVKTKGDANVQGTSFVLIPASIDDPPTTLLLLRKDDDDDNNDTHKTSQQQQKRLLFDFLDAYFALQPGEVVDTAWIQAQAEAAVNDAKQCIALNPQWAKGHVRLASAYIAQGGHSNDACNSLQTALTIPNTW